MADNLPFEVPDTFHRFAPELGVVLGSGLNFFGDSHFEVLEQLEFSQIEKFPQPTVPHHRGRFLLGHIGGRRTLCMQGRFHYYEGHSMEALSYPLRMMASAGIQSVILTNAVGGITEGFTPGAFAVVRDHINLMNANPLIGWKAAGAARFPDMSSVYCPAWRGRFEAAIGQNPSVKISSGVYAGTAGPCFETPAEIAAYRTLGADIVGMSGVPEATFACALGIKCLMLSCVTNLAAGISKNPLSYDEVKETADSVRPQFCDLLAAAVETAEDK